MKKLLLSAALIASFLTSKAQIGTGAYDDFNQVLPYSSATGGIYWWTDANYPTDYALTRTGTTLSVAVAKDVSYSVLGFGFGDSNGAAAGGTTYTLDLTNNKTFSISASADTPVRVDVQIADSNGVTLEVVPSATTANGHDKTGFTATTTLTNYTIDFSNAKVVANWTCAHWPTDCPTVDPTATAAFDWTNVKQIVFLISGGTAYQGTVTFDDMTLGTAPQTAGINLITGLNAASSVASSKLYPNPATEVANVEVSLKNASDVKVVVSDMLGKVVSEVSANNTASVNEVINVANLNKGIYTVSYYVNGAVAKTEKLAVK